MSAKLSDLADLVGKVITVQVDLFESDTDEDFREVVGRLLAVGDDGIVIQAKSKTEIIKIKDLLDFEETAKQNSLHIVRRWIQNVVLGSHSGAVLRRYVEEATVPSVRQHLTDRHGHPLDIIKALSPEHAMTIHEGIDHSKLGHEHGEKPPGKRGRKPKNATPEKEEAV